MLLVSLFSPFPYPAGRALAEASKEAPRTTSISKEIGRSPFPPLSLGLGRGRDRACGKEGLHSTLPHYRHRLQDTSHYRRGRLTDQVRTGNPDQALAARGLLVTQATPGLRGADRGYCRYPKRPRGAPRPNCRKRGTPRTEKNRE